jgi:RNA polymerase sigma factor (TIGR02999 family)
MVDARDVTQLLSAMSDGLDGAEEKLYERVYADLRMLAERQLRGGNPAATLGTTALVHETYLKLVDRSSIAPRDRSHFFATAARAMRQIVVDYIRAARAEKRGGGGAPIDFGDVESILSVGPNPGQRADEILAIDRALDRLDRKNPRLRQVVELRFFVGFDVDETARIMESSPRTVKRDWQVARAFLYRALSAEPDEGSP